jgi:hypothetical protein
MLEIVFEWPEVNEVQYVKEAEIQIVNSLKNSPIAYAEEYGNHQRHSA